MQPEFHAEVMRRFERDFNFKNQNDSFLQQGICPKCNHRELYTHKHRPWVLRCGRLNNCGNELHLKEVYPDLFDSWSDRFPSQQDPSTGLLTNPNSAADAYLQLGRGLKTSLIKDWYQQGSYYCGKRQIGTATIKFTLSNGTTWERFIDKPDRFGQMKAYFSGKYHGYWWQQPNFDINSLSETSELWLTEGIFDALSLLQIGIPAVSLMSCNNFPEHDLSELRKKLSDRQAPTLVFAFDRGKAGESFALKFIKRATQLGWQATAALPPASKAKLDWNDLLQRERLSLDDLQDYRYNGQLLTAPDAKTKGILMYQKTGQYEFPFEFRLSMYWFKFHPDKYDKLEETQDDLTQLQEASSVQLLCLCYPHALYFQDSPNADECWYYFQIDFPHGLTVKKTFTGAQISSSNEFKKRLSSIGGGAIFEGSTLQLNRWFREHLYSIKQVKVIDFVGYSKEHQSYVFNNIAVQDGVLYQINEEDYFEVKQHCIKSLNPTQIKPNYDLTQFKPDFFHYYYEAFSSKGVVILAY